MVSSLDFEPAFQSDQVEKKEVAEQIGFTVQSGNSGLSNRDHNPKSLLHRLKPRQTWVLRHLTAQDRKISSYQGLFHPQDQTVMMTSWCWSKIKSMQHDSDANIAVENRGMESPWPKSQQFGFDWDAGRLEDRWNMEETPGVSHREEECSKCLSDSETADGDKKHLIESTSADGGNTGY